MRFICLLSIYLVFNIWQFAYAQWVADVTQNLPIAVETGEQNLPRIAGTSDGNYIMVWDDKRSGNKDIYAQKLDKAGYILWVANGIPVCTAANDQRKPELTADDQGGVFIVWEDFRNGAEDIYAQRLDTDGNLLWVAGGIPLSTAAHSQNDPQIVPDASGGSYIVWASKEVDGINDDIYLQRIDSSGAVYWANNGVVVCDAPWGQNEPKLAADSTGNAFIVWEDWRADFDSPDIFAQRVDTLGVPQWAANGVAVSVTSGEQKQPQLAIDEAQNTFVTWQDNRLGNVDIFAQRLNPDGTPGWAVNGIPVCTAANSQYRPHIVYDGFGGCIISWHDFRHGSTPPFNIDVYAQRIDFNGNVLWQPDGVPVGDSPANQIDEYLITDGTGGAVLAWSEHPGNGVTDVYAQRIDSNGAKMWDPAGVPVCTAPHSQRKVFLCADGHHGAVVAWADEREYAQNKSDIYVHYVNSKGQYSNAAPGLKINELYYCGPVNNLYYFFDQFVELLNTGNTTVYLDGKIIARVRTSPEAHLMLADTAQAVYAFQFPGLPGEQNYPMSPGDFAVIASDAYDHSQVIPTAVNLENAHWEFYNQLGNDFDNPNVPNLLNINPSRTSDFYISLGSDYVVIADGTEWKLDSLVTMFGLRVYVDLPVSTILDGVEYSQNAFWKHANLIVDVGFAGMGIPKYSGKSTQRFFPGEDSNHSTHDFEVLNSPTPQIPLQLSNTNPNSPGTLKLLQNYPNPFNPETYIGFYLPATERVNLIIYNTLGQVVRKMNPGKVPAGFHQVIWDGTDNRGIRAPGGVYFYRLMAGKLTRSKKMILMR